MRIIPAKNEANGMQKLTQYGVLTPDGQVHWADETGGTQISVPGIPNYIDPTLRRDRVDSQNRPVMLCIASATRVYRDRLVKLFIEPGDEQVLKGVSREIIVIVGEYEILDLESE